MHLRKLSYYTLLYLKVYLFLAEDKQNKCKETTGAFYCSCVRCYVMVYNMYVDDTQWLHALQLYPYQVLIRYYYFMYFGNEE